MELVVISGKGGTGKTTIVAAISSLVKESIKVDCDVDAPNLYLLYFGKEKEKADFFGGKKVELREELCIQCGKCQQVCKFGAIVNFRPDAFACEGCGACVLVCPVQALQLKEEKTAETFLTETMEGMVARAKMEIGSDGSGKLVTTLRKKAKGVAVGEDFILCDGSPGIGCAVIASLTGTDAALIVTEPTRSGLEDLKRNVGLAEGFSTKIMICINKYDVNQDMTKDIEGFIQEKDLFLAGKIPFDTKVMEAVNGLKSITEFKDSRAKFAIEQMWVNIKEYLSIKI